ncbi:aminotransferase class I/II-fold pyridoxal phosphate-dependent enzyme [Streptomyces sp. L2]|uniref:aminotransferase class I/II-fold pyridoxal phosphate-dependent enzyme n=1 Tax=Streptomyces sp. L2 TaxID=2162665 RepID=UPI0013E90403|nr:aminotransferase class I/II-fold pyridoxal phosphate-dependent enzyme [Streptomyces sp. L2]
MSVRILTEEGQRFRRLSQSELTIAEPRHRTHGDFTGKQLRIAGRTVIDLSGLDYLALGSDPKVKELMRRNLQRHDCGIPGSEAIIRTWQVERLEQELAAYHFGVSAAAITFTAGYPVNFSLMEALGLRGNSFFLRMHADAVGDWPTAKAPTLFFVDSDLHFSARHGIRFATRLRPDRCSSRIYPTGDLARLEEQLQESQREVPGPAVRIILTDTVDSATGHETDMAPLCALAERYDCLVYADEAHAVGVIGPQGRGVTAKVENFDRYRNRLILMGTLTKAFCQPGGYVVLNDPDLAALLKLCSPQHVFSAPVPPWIADTARQMIPLVAGPHGDRRRRRLEHVSLTLREMLLDDGFDLVGNSASPIIALPLRRPELGEKVLHLLCDLGFVASVFQGPLRARGQEVLRLAMRADLTDGDLEALGEALNCCREKLHFT